MSVYCPEKNGPALYSECLECENKKCKKERKNFMKKAFDYTKRCANCVCLTEIVELGNDAGRWFCDEAQEFCCDIAEGDCPEDD